MTQANGQINQLNRFDFEYEDSADCTYSNVSQKIRVVLKLLKEGLISHMRD